MEICTLQKPNNMNTDTFTAFPKMARFSRECVITEKIDGTNASVYIVRSTESNPVSPHRAVAIAPTEDFDTSREFYHIYAGSRTRWITPEDDNFGFAKWVQTNATDLLRLGEGRHFGEWWGSGIQRGYGLKNGEKRFSLFNTLRWHLPGETAKRVAAADPRLEKRQEELPGCCSLVPVLWQGSFDSVSVQTEGSLFELRKYGSRAAPGFMKPEGIVIFHVAGNVGFKKTIDKDESPKSIA